MLHAVHPASASTSAWSIVSAAPHRPLFLAGAIQIVLTMSLWLAELAGRWLGSPLPFTLASIWIHATLMIYGVFPFFIYGFLFTVFPRWLGGGEVPRARYLSVALLAALGMIFVYLGLFTHRAVLALGLVFYLGGWLTALATLGGIYLRAPRRGAHEWLLLVALMLGALGVGCTFYAVVTGNVYGLLVARDIGLWGFLAPVLLTVSHRMIPFFTQSALPFGSVPRPAWSLALFVGGSLLHGALDAAALPAARLAVDAVLAGLALHHSWVWGFTRSLSVRLLAMLHVAFLWFGMAMSLYALQAALALAHIDALGRAPLHALGIGFVTGTLIAMATRVTLGHSGLALTVKAPTWYLFLGLNSVALLRIAAECAPAGAYQTLNLLAACGWLLCLVPWALRYAPLYLRARADARPG